MRNIITIFKRDLKGLATNFFALVVAIGLCLLPALYAWFNIYSNWDPYGNTKNIHIAVANMDEGWTNEKGEKLNMGADVVEELRGKDSIGWVFVDEEEAVEGVRSGQYYAALVIAKDFTYSMYHGVMENIENPHITYYVNGKKNAVATKITDTAVGTVQGSINRQFIKVVTEQIFTEANGLSEELEDEDAVAEFIGKLEKVNEDLLQYDDMISHFVEGNEYLGAVTEDAVDKIGDGQAKIADGVSKVDDGREVLAANQLSFNQFSAQVSTSLTNIETSIGNISRKIADAQLETDAQTLATDIATIQEDMKALDDELEDLKANPSLPSGTVDAIEKAQDALAAMPVVDAQTVRSATAESIKAVQNSLAGYQQTIASVNDMYNNQIVPQINNLMESMEDTLDATGRMLNALGTTAGGVGDILTGLDTTLDAANITLGELQTVIENTSAKLTRVLEELHDASAEEQLQIILNLLAEDPETLGNFFSEPVQVEENYIYEIANYGSGVAPFYTTLAIWVGMTILVSLIKVHADTAGLANVRAHELFFGRYLLFFLLSQIQTLVIVLGNLFLFRIQCLHPFLFWLAAAFTSLTFSLLIYALTIAFGDIGKALVVVVMVIQIAGSGGTFPIEALPGFFRAVYIFFPFPYAIDAMRECIGGMYQNKFSLCLVQLGLFCVAALAVGLVIRIPFIKVNHFIEKRMEDTKML